jgi:hypothetical protein
MTTRTQRARTRKAMLTAQYGPDHPKVIRADDELALYRAADAIRRNRRSSWTREDRIRLEQLINGSAPGFIADPSAEWPRPARARRRPGKIPRDGDPL